MNRLSHPFIVWMQIRTSKYHFESRQILPPGAGYRIAAALWNIRVAAASQLVLS